MNEFRQTLVISQQPCSHHLLLSPQQTSILKPSTFATMGSSAREQKNGSQEGEWRQKGEHGRMSDHTQCVRHNRSALVAQHRVRTCYPVCFSLKNGSLDTAESVAIAEGNRRSTVCATQKTEIFRGRRGPRSRRHTLVNIPHAST